MSIEQSLQKMRNSKKAGGARPRPLQKESEVYIMRKFFVAFNYTNNERIYIVDDTPEKGFANLETLANTIWDYEEYVFFGYGDTPEEAIEDAEGAAEEYCEEYPYFGDFIDNTDSWKDFNANIEIR